MKKIIATIALLLITLPTFARNEENFHLLNKKLQNFEYITLGGVITKIFDFRGNRPLLISIGDTNEERYNHKLDLLNTVVDKYEGKVAVIEILSGDKKPNEEIIKFYEHKNIKCEVVLDPDGKIVKMLGITKTPVIVVYDKHGVARFVCPEMKISVPQFITRVDMAIRW